MRAKLTNVIRGAFPDFNFRQGFIYRTHDSSIQFPCLWLTPPELTGKEGRDEGYVSYRVVLYLLGENDVNFTEERKARIWQEMENRALEAYRALGNNHEVHQVRSIETSPDEHDLTGYLEISLKVTLQIDMIYCRE